MTALEAIELQKKENQPVTEEFLGKMKNKTYQSGREIKVGDNVIFGLIVKPNTDMVKKGATFSGFNQPQEQAAPGVELHMIAFHPEEFGVIYEEDDLMNKTRPDSKIPFIKLIQNGN